jgi:hypothetical protein
LILSTTGKENHMSTTTAIIILNAVLIFGIVAVIVSLCAGAIFTSPGVERRHRRSFRLAHPRTAPVRRSTTAGAFVRHPSYEA